VNKVYDRLVKYKLVKNKTDSLTMKIQLASNWANDYLSSKLVRMNVNVSKAEQEALLDLIQYLKNMNTKDDKGELAVTIQSEIFSIAQKRGLQPRGFFKVLYRILINTEKGPRLGNYILDMGIKWTYEQLDSCYSRLDQETNEDSNGSL